MGEILVGHDADIARWMFAKAKCLPMAYNLALGVMNDTGLIGGIMFTGYNGSDAEVHYYGPGGLTRKTVRAIFQAALGVFNLNRLTIRTRKDSMRRGVRKLGAVEECFVKRLYGPTDAYEHGAHQYVFYRETMEKLAGLKESQNVR